MKKLFVMVAMLAVAATASAQLYVGTSSISMFGGVDNTLMTGVVSQGDDTAWGISPEIGYNLNDKWTLGLGIGYTSWGDKNNMFGVNPYVRYYGWRSGDFSVYFQGNVEYATYKLGDGNTNMFGINVAPGVAYSFTPHWGINTTFGFLGYEKHKGADGAFGLVLNSGLAFGLTYSF